MAGELPYRTELLTRWSMLRTERSSWFSHWREISEFIQPRIGRFFVTDSNKGMRRHNSIYDSTGTRALRVLAAGMMSGMTSPARPWFRLDASDEDLRDSHAVKEWLATVTALIHRIFQKSNTYRALHSIYEELGAFGTAATIVVDDFKNVIHHFPLTCGEYAISTNWRGEVDTLYREFQSPVAAVVKEFGYANCSTSTQALYDRGGLDKWVRLVHAIESRADRDAAKATAPNMPWRSVYFELNSNDNKLLRDSGFKRFRALVPRWAVAGGDIYGNSPGMEALGDIKQLQHEQLRKSQGIDFQTKPPLQVPTALKGREVDALPGGVTYVDGAGQSAPIKTMFDVQLDLKHLLADIQDVRQRVQGAFYADLFLMLANQTDSRMTATEVAERHEEKLLMLGPVLERLQNELLDPLIELTFDRIMETGIAPPPPPELQGKPLQVELISMLAQAQRAVGTNSIDRFVGNLGAIAQVKPEVLDKLDVDRWADVYSDALGLDPTIIVPADKVAAIRQQRAQAQQAAQNAALANSHADTAQKLGNTPTGGDTALADITRQFQGYQ